MREDGGRKVVEVVKVPNLRDWMRWELAESAEGGSKQTKNGSKGGVL